MSSQQLSQEQRSEILQKEIRKYVKQGYRVVSQTSTTVQLMRDKSFSKGCGCLALPLYLIFWLGRRNPSVYIEVDEHGKINRMK